MIPDLITEQVSDRFTAVGDIVNFSRPDLSGPFMPPDTLGLDCSKADSFVLFLKADQRLLFIHQMPGQLVSLLAIQDVVGGRTLTWPGLAPVGVGTIASAPGAVSRQWFICGIDGVLYSLEAMQN